VLWTRSSSILYAQGKRLLTQQVDGFRSAFRHAVFQGMDETKMKRTAARRGGCQAVSCAPCRCKARPPLPVGAQLTRLAAAPASGGPLHLGLVHALEYGVANADLKPIDLLGQEPLFLERYKIEMNGSNNHQFLPNRLSAAARCAKEGPNWSGRSERSLRPRAPPPSSGGRHGGAVRAARNARIVR